MRQFGRERPISHTAFRALIVDDDPSQRYLLRLLLEDMGAATQEAADGSQSLPLFQQWRPDLILMDMQMPAMNGLEAIRRIRATPAGAKVPIFLVSACPAPGLETDALAAGANGFLCKPLVGKILSEKIRTVLDLGGEGHE